MKKDLQITELQVLRSAAGYYIGRMCNEGPYSRDSGYYRERKDAQMALDIGEYEA